jgi:hypothetical protein
VCQVSAMDRQVPSIWDVANLRLCHIFGKMHRGSILPVGFGIGVWEGCSTRIAMVTG